MMTRADLTEEVSGALGTSRKDSDITVVTILDSIVPSLRSGDSRDPLVRQLRYPAAPVPDCPQSKNRRARRSSCEKDPVFQAQQGIDGFGELGVGSHAGHLPFALTPNSSCLSESPVAW
jgi:hypothetical protein